MILDFDKLFEDFDKAIEERKRLLKDVKQSNIESQKEIFWNNPKNDRRKKLR